MPHLWMFLLQALTPPEHEVQLVDGNARPMNDAELVQFVLDQKVELVGIGAMTRMIAKAYRVADALRAKGISVVMGGPHVTEVPDEALAETEGLVTRMPSPWAKRMRRGRGSSRMQPAASSKTRTSR